MGEKPVDQGHDDDDTTPDIGLEANGGEKSPNIDRINARLSGNASAQDTDTDTIEEENIAQESIGAASGSGPLEVSIDEQENTVTLVDDQDEIVMSFTGAKFPEPFQSIAAPEGFIKHDNDRILGDMKYKEDKVSQYNFSDNEL